MGKRLDAALEMQPVLSKGAQSLVDKEALKVKGIYPEWTGLLLAGQVDWPEPGYKFTHNRDLYKCNNPNPEFRKEWEPGISTLALYTRIDEEHAGTIEDPIPAARGMEYEYFKYYLDPETETVYLCQYGNTDTTGTIVLAYLPHELVGVYFKEIQ